ncbi:pyridoxine/pyridoxamine 5'-phosphate oxidase [Georgenia sp. H159]|uniref:pyridoxine/pyridoxamine 5'-phosphate oxidase n=1 Tax=Georgenia sp. H159 TaxID=3076115 RepID=UPI002D7749B5|nr:pyridoxamine 5'-phosphate oxidase family protein [Georgenia sp. H159]
MTDTTRAWLRTLRALTGTPPPVEEPLPDDPVALFLGWLEVAVAAGVPEPHVMTLATVDADGVPDARALILKDVDERGWAFSTTASSRKGAQLSAAPEAALAFWWQPQARAVRVRGPVVQATREESEADLHARSPAAQASVAPGDWTLWRVRPTRVEFWQGAPDRNHLRIVYLRSGDGWSLARSFTVG